MLNAKEIQAHLTAEGLSIGKAAAAGNMLAQRLIDLSAASGAPETLSSLVRFWSSQNGAEATSVSAD